MDGNPRQQVLDVVKRAESDGLTFSIINYSSSAKTLTGKELHIQLTGTWQGGMTNFNRAFSEMIKLLNSGRDVDFIFLTDGEASDNPYGPDGIPYLKQQIARCNNKVSVHVFGLGSNSDRSLLESLRKLGTTEGVFNYAGSNSSGNEIADEILTSIIIFDRYDLVYGVYTKLVLCIINDTQYNYINL